MKIQALAIVAAIALAACSKPTETIIPSDTSKWDTELAPVVKKLPEEDQKLFVGYITRAKMSELFSKGGSVIPLGTTVGTAIAEQKKWETEQLAKAEEERALKEKLQKEAAEARAAFDKSVTVVLVSLGRIPKDYQAGRFLDKQEFVIGASNRSTETIVGVSGSLDFVDIFDKVIGGVNFSISEKIEPGATVKWIGSRDYNEFIAEHRAVWNLEEGKYTTRFIPRTIVFADGRKLSVEKQP